MKFQLKEFGNKGAVAGFKLKGRTYLPGEIIDLPATYEGSAYLIRIDPVPVVTPPPQKITPVVKKTVKPVEPTEAAVTVDPIKTAESSPVDWGASK